MIKKELSSLIFMEKQAQSILFSLNEIDQTATRLLVAAGDRKKWLFRGEIGAGKTTMIKALCKQLGSQEFVTSPTYSIINEYTYLRKNTQLTASIYHMDLYRLNSGEEALQIGIEDYLYGPDYCFIEWPDIITELLPESCFEIQLSIVGDSKRKIIFV